MRKKNKANIFRIVVLDTLLTMLLVCAVGVASASINFDGSPGNDTPPATLGPYTMTPFPGDPTAEGTLLSSLPSPLGGNLGFSSEVTHYIAGSLWPTWSHGYTGDVYFTGYRVTSLTLTMPPDTGAFYFYSEPNVFGTVEITATADDGTTSGPVTMTNPVDSPKYFGFYATGGSHVASITVTCSEEDGGFAVGEFGIACPPVDIPEFPSIVLPVATIIGLAFIMQRRKN